MVVNPHSISSGVLVGSGCCIFPYHTWCLDEIDMKVISARITAMPLGLFDPMPQVYATTEDNTEHLLFEYYPDELSFTPADFIGLDLDAARRLKYVKDVAYLRS